jgi:hypothetical protein
MILDTSWSYCTVHTEDESRQQHTAGEQLEMAQIDTLNSGKTRLRKVCTVPIEAPASHLQARKSLSILTDA